jgi:hypothetical protein
MFPASRAARLRLQYSLGELDALELRWIEDLDPVFDEPTPREEARELALV